MAKRGPSISVKMILGSTLLIVLIVVGFGLLSVYQTRSFYQESTKERIEQFRKSLQSKGETATTLFANGAYNFLVNTNYDDAKKLVKASIERDPELKVAYILDSNKVVFSHSDEGRYGNYAEKPEEIKDGSWAEILKTWETRASKGVIDPLVEGIEITTQQDGQLLFFALPVFSGVEATSERAAAEKDDDNVRLGYIVLGYTLDPIRRFTKQSQVAMEQAIYDSALKTGAVGGIFVLIGTILAIFQGLRISKPLKILAWRADQIARGDLDARVEVTSTDEIGILGENFNFMADQIQVLLHQTAEKATLEKELEVARTIQETLVPSEAPVDKGFIQFAGYYLPASECGGDWWTYHDLIGDKLLMVVGDVTGHGVPSAMITATAKAAVDVARDIYNDDVDVTKVLEIMNGAIFESAKRKFVMTCFASIIDPHTRMITYANAGHNFPYIYRVPEGKKRGEFGSLMIRGNRLGDMRESKFEAKAQQLLPGDTIIWYTDGIVECENPAGEEFGEKRFRASIRKSADLAPGEIRDSIVNDAMSFFGDAPRKDDITMVIGKIA